MLRRRLSLLQAVSLNMAMMVGIGPFITIPEFLKKLDGPQVMIGWVIGALIALADGLIWSELAAAFPGSGGTYHFFEAVYGESRTGRLLKFLFVWQFLFSAPLEVATGAIGLAHYVGYLWPALKWTAWSWHVPVSRWGTFTWQVQNEQLLAIGVMLAITALAYRRIEVAGRLMVVLWAGMLATVAVVIASGLGHFNAAQAFAMPSDAFTLDARFAMGLGAAVGIAMYDFLGYYQICYLGDEVDDAPRTIPRAILISVVAVALVYLTMNVSILGVLPRQEVIASTHVASDMMQRLYGSSAAQVVTTMIIWTAAASTFAALLGYSRVPYAAARSGHFFKGLARTHPTGQFPHRSLLLVAGLATLACLADLVTVIEALLTSRILIQFVAQIATVFYLRTRPDLRETMPFRMWFFPLPALFALAGWLYIFGTSRPQVILYGLGSLVLGTVVFLVWNRLAAKSRLDLTPVD
ncbi:APC family permease [Singulisphaera acidiphila]|uniref:Amino acid transporter n=1 Tax=Singulisphaera acidiphila (strain ATCC BAA-1392 / DSM 18658 / VKM B-2454 / MOB10) TaxID=886293 RepID=L0DAR0_SINAD|nr:amino acid permease [Singulisphaera acidiphila]AGA25761.1 amino acid transporter [Singulisphaera acidiphila DSM 18658]